jgi:GTPase SAR1 family protein
VLVYDQSDESSFANLDKWKSEIDSFLPYADKILVANKIDLHDARVAKETAKSWASTNGYLFAECSAKSGSNVQSTFEQVINAYYEHSMHMKPKKKKQQVSLKKPADAKEKKKSFPCLI